MHLSACTYMLPVFSAALGEFFPTFNKKNACVAYLSFTLCVQTKAARKMRFIFQRRGEPRARRFCATNATTQPRSVSFGAVWREHSFEQSWWQEKSSFDRRFACCCAHGEESASAHARYPRQSAFIWQHVVFNLKISRFLTTELQPYYLGDVTYSRGQEKLSMGEFVVHAEPSQFPLQFTCLVTKAPIVNGQLYIFICWDSYSTWWSFIVCQFQCHVAEGSQRRKNELIVRRYADGTSSNMTFQDNRSAKRPI